MRKLLVLTVVAAIALMGMGGVQAQDTKEIDLWHIQAEPVNAVIQDAADRYMADHPDVKVNVEQLQNDPFKVKIKAALGAGDAPCAFPSWGGGPMIEYINAGHILDISEYMNADDYMVRFTPASLSQVMYDGGMYGVPVENTVVAVIFYNKSIFEELGLTPPATWDELMTIVDTLVENDIAPFALANKTKWTSSMYYMYLVDRLGGPEVFAAAAAREGSFEDPVFIEAGQMVQDLVERGAFNEGFNGLDYDTGQSRMLMYAGQGAMELMGSWNVSTVIGENPDFAENELGFFPFPAIEGGAGDPYNVVGTAMDNAYHISANCEYPEETFQLLQYLIDDTSVAARIEGGRIPPVMGVDELLTDPVLQGIMGVVSQAPSVQLWYDQYLPPELGEVHKDTMQALFGLEITPEEAAKIQEDATAEYYGE